MRRVSVVGSPGSGKSTVATALAGRLGVPHVELDAIFHQPGWTELRYDEFRHQVALAASGESWVIDGNYPAVRDLVWERADTVVWLDLPRRVVMRRIIRRTLVRLILRRELWNGNRERWRDVIHPARSLLVWAWRHQTIHRDRYAAAMSEPTWDHLRFFRLSSPPEVKRFLADAGPQIPQGASRSAPADERSELRTRWRGATGKSGKSMRWWRSGPVRRAR